MAKTYASLVLVIFVSLLVLVGLLCFYKPLEPSSLGLILVLAGIGTLAVKFWVADVLSSDGFDDEKAAVDLTLMLSSTIFALALVQYKASYSVFPEIEKLVDGVGAAPSAERSGHLMWWAFSLSVILFGASFVLTSRLRSLRAQKGPFNRPALRKGLMSLMRLMVSGCFTLSYALYMVTVLYKV